MVMTGDSYGVNETKHSVSETTSSLVISNVNRQKQQMGRYQCVAKNSLGKDVKSVNIYLNPEATLPPTTTTTTITTTTTSEQRSRKHKKSHKKRDPEKRRKHWKKEQGRDELA